MSFFEQFKGMMQRTVTGMRVQDTRRQLLEALDRSDNWTTLEREFVRLRELSRERQSDLIHRMEPLEKKAKHLLEEAKQTPLRQKREALLNMANSYAEELEALGKPSRIYLDNTTMLTRLIAQIQAARAMDEQGIDPDVVDGLNAQLEEVAERYGEVGEAVSDLEKAAPRSEETGMTVADVEARLQGLYEAPGETGAAAGETVEDRHGLDELERRLYGQRDAE